MGRQVVRLAANDKPERLGKTLFRKHMMRPGRWEHPNAPGGELVVDRPFLEKIAENFHAGARDTVPIPLSHKDTDGITSIGRVVDVEVTDEGLFGYHLITKEENAKKIEDDDWYATSVMVEPNFRNKETSKDIGPTLIHNAITNAPYMTGLAPFEAVAFGDDAPDITVLDFRTGDGPDGTKGEKMNVTEFLAENKDMTDEDFLKDLAEARPELAKSLKVDPEAIKAAAAKETRDEIAGHLAESGIVIEFPTEKAKAKGEKTKAKVDDSVDISEHPAFVALSDAVKELTETQTKSAVETRVDQAIREGRVLPTEKEGLVAVGFSDSDLLNTLLDARKPNSSIVMSEVGFKISQEPGETVDLNGVPQVSDPAAERERYKGVARSVGATVGAAT